MSLLSQERESGSFRPFSRDELFGQLLSSAQTTSVTECIWPEPYDQDTAEAGYRFLTECWWTLNEADQAIALVPPKAYIREFCNEWHAAFSKRKPMIVEKSRRLLLSWVCRGLETWQLGLKRGESVIIDQRHENSAEHLWRVHFSLRELQQRRPDVMSQRHEVRGSPAIKAVTHVVLPNGSVMTQDHQDADGAQGKGKTIVVLEEISKYKAPASYWAQALIVSMGAAGGSGGWVFGIANSSPKAEWKEIKGKRSARTLLGMD